MKKQLLAAMILGTLSLNSFALPAASAQPLLGESRDSSVKTLITHGANLQSEGGSDRLIERQRIQVAEGGSDRLIERRQQHIQVAEGGSDRLIERRQQHIQVAEGGSDRLIERRQQHMQVAEGGSDRLIERQHNRNV